MTLSIRPPNGIGKVHSSPRIVVADAAGAVTDTMLVIHADLPALRSEDVTALVDLALAAAMRDWIARRQV